jgi:heat shock protein HslJ
MALLRGAGRVVRILVLSSALLACGGGSAMGGDDEAAVLIGTRWQLERIQMMDDTELRPANPSRYTLELAADGSVAVRADCNHGRGSYRLDGVQLRLGPLASTKMMCPPGSLGDRYTQLLAISASWMIVDEKLAIATAMDSAILFFTPVR